MLGFLSKVPHEYQRLIIGLVISAAIGFGVIYFRTDFEKSLVWLASIGLYGNLILVLCFLVASFPVPVGTTPLMLSCGFLYGLAAGIVTVMIGSMFGASVSFYGCRLVFKNWVENEVRKSKAMLVLMKALDENAFKLCVLVRLLPVPYGLQNAMFAISKMEFSTYFTASWLGLLPEMLVIVYIGSSAKELSDMVTGGSSYSRLQTSVLIGQLVLSLLVIIAVVIKGRKLLSDAMALERSQSGTDGSELTELTDASVDEAQSVSVSKQSTIGSRSNSLSIV
eukprot:TRINITY_DN4316_c0_g1_i1.p1 TRINITY_DN4316_c0_g1~~TRINITY_DN4316_c0_g1_i1.p1  ORF type:complete len:280 (+),score=17.48 TRINITY_DN4316_c0_g1_i1:167-1006(+)